MNTSAISATSLISLDKIERTNLMLPGPAAIATDHATEFHRGMHVAPAVELEECLDKGQLRLLPAREHSVLCLAGQLWVTRDGDIEDYILGPGQRLAIGRHDQAAVQALQPSRFRLTRA